MIDAGKAIAELQRRAALLMREAGYAPGQVGDAMFEQQAKQERRWHDERLKSEREATAIARGGLKAYAGMPHDDADELCRLYESDPKTVLICECSNLGAVCQSCAAQPLTAEDVRTAKLDRAPWDGKVFEETKLAVAKQGLRSIAREQPGANSAVKALAEALLEVIE